MVDLEGSLKAIEVNFERCRWMHLHNKEEKPVEFRIYTQG